jgi:hypothetical protein
MLRIGGAIQVLEELLPEGELDRLNGADHGEVQPVSAQAAEDNIHCGGAN